MHAHLSGFPTEKRVSRTLSDIDPKKLFTWPVGLNEEHGKYLIDVFYKHYRHRQIGHLQFDTFRNWVESRYFETWREKYAALFKSVLEVNNSNWDTENVERESETVDENTLNRASGFNQGTTSGSHNELTSRNSSSDEAGWESDAERVDVQASELTLANSEAKDLRIDDDLDTQTPQTTVLTQPAPLPTPTVDGLSAGTGAATWNDGFLTEATRHNKSGWANTHDQKGTDQDSTTDSMRVSAQGTSANGWTAGTVQESTMGASKSVSRNTANSLRGIRRVREKSGRGRTLAELMVEFRETLLPITHQWVKEFDTFFLEIF